MFLNDILYVQKCTMLWTAYYSTDVLYKNLYIPCCNLSSSILFGILCIYIYICLMYHNVVHAEILCILMYFVRNDL